MTRRERLGTVAGGALLLLGLAAGGGADGETYRWVDERGQVHYSNVPANAGAAAGAERLQAGQGTVSGATRGRVQAEETVESNGTAGSGETAIEAADQVVPPSTADAALGRNALDAEERRVRTRLAEIERELDRLGQSRLAHAERGHESVGGLVAAGAAEARSEAELALEKEREQLARQLEDIGKRRAAVAAPPAVAGQ